MQIFYLVSLFMAVAATIAFPIASVSGALALNSSAPTLVARFAVKDILAVINRFDAAYNIPHKAWSSQLAANAHQTVKDNHGRTENHELHDGTHAQVLVPGRYAANPSTGPFHPFELSYYAWLCEVKDPQLDGRCGDVARLSAIVYPDGDTGHHDILTSRAYTKIGCGFFLNDQQHDVNSPFQGLWACDLA